MIICTFYSHTTGFDKIVDILKSEYPKGVLMAKSDGEFMVAELEIKGGLFRANQKFKISYRQRSRLSHELPETDDSPLTTNLRGLYGYVNSFPARNQIIKGLLLRKIVTLNAEFSVIHEEGNQKKLDHLIHELAKKFDAILFVQSNTSINKTSGQHFLDKNLDLLLDSAGNSVSTSLDVKIDSVYFDGPPSQLSVDQTERRQRTEHMLEKSSVKINKNLPVIESEAETEIRSSMEIAQRVTILALVNLVAFGTIQVEEALDYIKGFGLWDLVTPKEKNFLKDPTPEKKNRESWKVEDIYVLLWALKIAPELDFPDSPVSLDDMDAELYPVGKNKDPNDFIRAARNSRTKAEILDAADLYYRMDWACVDARLNARKIEGMHPGVVYERHYALNWLINYSGQDWDDISCDT